MGKRGPKPAGPKLKQVKQVKPRRPNPKQGMSQPARTIWLRIVKAYPVDHFKPQHHGLLMAYCDAEAMYKKSRDLLSNEDIVITQGNMVKKENPLIGIMEKMAARMTSISVKLGISVNNTTAARGIKGSVPQPKSKRGDLINRG